MPRYSNGMNSIGPLLMFRSPARIPPPHLPKPPFEILCLHRSIVYLYVYMSSQDIAYFLWPLLEFNDLGLRSEGHSSDYSSMVCATPRTGGPCSFVRLAQRAQNQRLHASPLQEKGNFAILVIVNRTKFIACAARVVDQLLVL